MKTQSLRFKRYILTYLCGVTEYSFVYLLKNKSEHFERFKKFKNYYELLTGNKIKEFRTDNGREYLSNEFQKYLKEHGIKHSTSPEYCPQSNGKAERLNRTLIEKARCMIISQEMNLNLWGAAINTANYLRNISPSSVLNGKSPHEVLFKKLPKLNHLRIFCCQAYPLDLGNKKDKFEPVAKRNCNLVGYGDKEGIYWLLDKDTNKIFRSRDAIFNEKIREKQERDEIELDLSIDDENFTEDEIENTN